MQIRSGAEGAGKLLDGHSTNFAKLNKNAALT
jgi:hypothetical protein